MYDEMLSEMPFGLLDNDNDDHLLDAADGDDSLTQGATKKRRRRRTGRSTNNNSISYADDDDGTTLNEERLDDVDGGSDDDYMSVVERLRLLEKQYDAERAADHSAAETESAQSGEYVPDEDEDEDEEVDDESDDDWYEPSSSRR